MNRIDATFRELRRRQRRALIPFFMAGDPDLATTRRLLGAAVESGADLLEVGVPFSDPTADGPALQHSIEVALRAGTSLPRVLELIADFRRHFSTPIILYGYYNPIFRYGTGRFAADASRAGVDGVLVVDLPPEEAAELHPELRRHGVHFVFLLTPTSGPDRVAKVLRHASGFVYYVSLTGVTGSRDLSIDAVRRAVIELRGRTDLPIGVGFGISTPQQAAAVCEFADAAVVGSAVMRLVDQNADVGCGVAEVGRFIAALKAAIDADHR